MGRFPAVSTDFLHLHLTEGSLEGGGGKQPAPPPALPPSLLTSPWSLRAPAWMPWTTLRGQNTAEGDGLVTPSSRAIAANRN